VTAAAHRPTWHEPENVAHCNQKIASVDRKSIEFLACFNGP